MRVRGEGPCPSNIMLIGEASGFVEEKLGRPFVGPSGKELTRFLRLGGIDRADCYVTNLVKERPFTRSATGNNAPTAEDIKRDESELVKELSTVRPYFIGAVGAVASKWLLGRRYDSIESQHGLVFPLTSARAEQCRFGNDIPYVCVLTHPAAGLHDNSVQQQVLTDFLSFGGYVRGELSLMIPEDPFPTPDYFEIKTSSIYLMQSRPVYVDTEGLLGRVWGLSYTQTPGCAAVIRKSNVKALRSFREQIRGKRIVMHHALHDIPIIAELLGMSVEEFLSWIGGFDDTMVKAYVLRTVPLALKPSCRRFHGMQMEDYLDVVRDANTAIAVEFLKRLLREKCGRCGGAGQYLVTPTSEKTGKVLAPRVLNCEDCEGDGTSFSSPDEYIEYENGVAKTRRGSRIGNRVRRVLFDVRHKPWETNARERYERVDYEYRLKIEAQIGEMRAVSLDDVVPQERAVTYSAKDADATNRYDNTLDAMIEADTSGLTRRVYEIDRDTLPILAVMMDRGTYIDVPYLNKLDRRLESECDNIIYKLQREVGHYVNPGSSQQVADVLFGELHLPVIKETKGGDASTQDKVLEDLKLQVAVDNGEQNKRALRIINLITDHRERSKLRGTYTLPLPRKVDRNGRLHTTFNSTRTDTNRLSSSDPNIQNISARTELGMLVRGAFTTGEGFSLLSVDYSQIEVRVIAHVSGDRHLIDGINSGVDVHYITASRIFKTPIGKVSKKQRAISKRITFLILYGGGALRLQAELKLEGIEVTADEAQGYIDAYLLDAYPGISDYMLETVAHAKRYGYVQDMFGWRRYLPGVHSSINSVRMEAERMAVNAPIQSGAAGVMRLACPVILQDAIGKVRRRGYDCWPLMTVHDEFVCEVQKGGEEMLLQEMTKAMTGVVELAVPVLAEGKFGARWSELK